MGLSGSHNVSPVVTSFKPTNATISPALASLISSLLLACMSNILPILSFFPEVEFKTLSFVETVPEYTLAKVKLPTKGSVIILNAKALNGSLSSHFLDNSLDLSLTSTPLILSTSIGEGM